MHAISECPLKVSKLMRLLICMRKRYSREDRNLCVYRSRYSNYYIIIVVAACRTRGPGDIVKSSRNQCAFSAANYYDRGEDDGSGRKRLTQQNPSSRQSRR